MSDADRQKWNNKYQQEGRQAPKAPPALLDSVHYLQAGKTLDVASGEGAVALYLSKFDKFQVTALDVSDIGLQNLSIFAQQQGLQLETLCLDMDDLSALAVLEKYTNICMFRFKPDVALIKQLLSLLAPNGRLVISTFNQQHHLNCGFAAKFCLEENEFTDLGETVEVIAYLQSEQAPFTDTYVLANK
ncbi:MAG: class I SAM-dependent methyltransferase [Oceanospirillaceae bacterium]